MQDGTCLAESFHVHLQAVDTGRLHRGLFERTQLLFLVFGGSNWEEDANLWEMNR